MIHALRKLARTIHRRSLWQVLGVYLFGSWVLFEVVRLVTDVVGLPSFAPTLTLVLLVAMLPLVVATTAVQGGLPGLRIEDEIDPNELVGRTPAEVHVIPEAHPLYGSGLFTWKNMVLGGVSSAALLVTSVIAYLTMWALGIGPVGSLIAQGVIQEGDPLALASFTNRTDDPSLVPLMADVFELELSRSEVVTLVGPGEEVEGAGLDLSVEIARRRAGYLVSSRLHTPTGTLVARFERASSGEDDLLFTLEQATERVRERLGESLLAIREGQRLAPITTDSTAALKHYLDAGRAWSSGDLSAAIELLQESVAVDPTFAMAWRRLGVVAEEAGDTATARRAYQRVVELWAPGGSAERTVEEMRERITALE